MQVVPHDVFGFNAIVVPDGFLVPGHSDGGVYVIKMSDNDITKTVSTTKISPYKKGYFYHMGFWVDLNGDGRKDFLTARSNAQVGGGELVWFEHPSTGLDGNEWAEHVITSGPDVGIELVDGIYNGEYVIFAAEFFNELLSMYRISKKDGSLIDHRVLDDKILSAYSVSYTDINGDGIKELLVNNHEKSNKTNGIWAYSAPVNWMTEDWTKHTIATGFHNAFSITVPNMSPGFPYAFYPKESDEAKWNAPAHILVAGDGDHTAHIMSPTDPKNWKWELDTLVEMGGTVGALTWADLD